MIRRREVGFAQGGRDNAYWTAGQVEIPLKARTKTVREGDAVGSPPGYDDITRPGRMIGLYWFSEEVGNGRSYLRRGCLDRSVLRCYEPLGAQVRPDVSPMTTVMGNRKHNFISPA